MADNETRSDRGGRNGFTGELSKHWQIITFVFACGVLYARVVSLETKLIALDLAIERHVALPMHAESHREITLLKARTDSLETNKTDVAAELRGIQAIQSKMLRRLDAVCVAMGPQCKIPLE